MSKDPRARLLGSYSGPLRDCVTDIRLNCISPIVGHFEEILIKLDWIMELKR